MLPLLDLRDTPAGFPLDLPRPDLVGPGPVAEVRAILDEVRSRGDVALRELTERFDHLVLGDLRVDEAEIAAARSRVNPELVCSLEEAAASIEAFHRHRGAAPALYERRGITVRHLEIPVARAGVYTPGGRAKYPSSVLMTVIPARVAGVGSVVCCAPPGPDGSPPDEILAAAAIAGVDEVYAVGGAQAIAAMAYGTESIAAVDVIVGPGNRYVSLAQQEVSGVVGVPSGFAGPSEVVVVADESTPPSWAAMDLAVQAEHGPDGLAWLVTWSEPAAKAVAEELDRLVEASPRRDETLVTLGANGHIVLVRGPVQAMEVVNEIAPEHLELLVDGADMLLGAVRNAGAVFLGALTPASVGDYLAGPSHVLPTMRAARFSSALGVEDFVRRVHAIEVGKDAMSWVAGHVAAIAVAEGLPAHAESVRLRTGVTTWSTPLAGGQ